MTTFIKQFFNKEPADLTIADIREYFKTPQVESSTIEFKSGEVDIIDVFKEVAAFLNTEGGLVFIGAPRETKMKIENRSINCCQGEITYSKFISKDWLNQKIFSNISPSPTNIFIKEISTKGGNLFILDVPQSSNPPHQSNADGRYYIRIDTEAKPAPHGLVKALFDKRRKPELYSRLDYKKNDSKNDSIRISLRNNSNIPADKVSFLIELFNVSAPDETLSFTEYMDEEFGRKLSYSNNAGQVLARIIAIGIPEFKVRHFNKKYIITVMYWSRETDFDCTIYIIDPTIKSVEVKNWLDEGVNLSEEIRQLYL